MDDETTIIYSWDLELPEETLRVIQAGRERELRRVIELMERRRAERERGEDPPQRSA